LPYDPEPLAGKLVKDDQGNAVILTNRSARAVMVTKEPAGIEYRGTGFFAGGAGAQKAKSKQAFVRLAPGASMRVIVDPQWTKRSDLERLDVYNGNQFGFKGWIGAVTLKFKPKFRSLERHAHGF
jgi:hypothetical protein